MTYGSMANDNGHLLLDEIERKEFLRDQRHLAPYVRPFVGGQEFINGERRWCLWLEGIPPALLKASKPLLARVDAVKKFRQSSDRAATQKLAQTPYLFGENRQPETPYLLLPKVSSEKREYLPIGFMDPITIANGSALVVAQANYWTFGVLQSAMHMAWMRITAGRMKSDYQYSVGIVYNNFPWPDLSAPTGRKPSNANPDKKRAAIEAAAQAVLDARATHPGATLADLYDPLAMPPNLRKAHQHLDKAVDQAYAYTGPPDDAGRVAFLFGLYAQLI